MTIVVPVAVAPPPLPQPDPGDRATFSVRKLSEMEWSRSTMIPGVKALADASYSNALDTQASAAAAALDATSTAATAANVAAMSNFKGTWASQSGALNKPASVSHNGAFWALLNNLANVTTSQPGVSADWAVVGGAFPVVPINTNTIAAPWTTYLIYGSCTLTLPAIAGSGQQVGVIVLAGVNGAVIAPAGSDKIRAVSGVMPVDPAPFDAILTDKGASYGWV